MDSLTIQSDAFLELATIQMGSYAIHMDTTTSRVLENIKKIADHFDRSNKGIAEAAGIPVSSYDRKLNHTGKFTLEELSTIAEALGVTPVDLFSKDIEKFIAELDAAGIQNHVA